MENIIIYNGIKTNNLKNISLEIPKGSFIGIAGPSGSGKSSLTYDTIYSISQYEWEKVSNATFGNLQTFEIEKYKNVVPAIALKQENLNNNPRSTIATFLHLDKDFRLLFSLANNVSPSLFTFNNPSNACRFCEGLGHEALLESDQMIDWNIAIIDKPFQPWKKSYKQKLLEKYAQTKNIPLDIKIKDLNKDQIDSLLNSKSSEKYKVTYVMGGKKRTKEFFYVGLLQEMQELKNDKKHISSYQKVTEYTSKQPCKHCKGMRFSDEILKYTYNNKSIGDLYQMEFVDLLNFIEISRAKNKHEERAKLFTNISRILIGLIEGKLEYLQLNRGIPSLSGGELQRIRLINILTSQITGMLYIVDEPSARLHVSEYDSIIQSFLKLRAENNTVLMIEHNPYFLAKTDRNIFIGPGSGDKGGYITVKNEFKKDVDYVPRECNAFWSFANISENNLRDVTVNIPVNCITGIYGPSGSGKSTLVKNIRSRQMKAEYINQKPLRGSIASTVASYCGVFDDIRSVFNKLSNIDNSYFSFATKEGQCPNCLGKGIIKYTLDFGKTEIETICEECKGKRFNNAALVHRFHDYSIYDILNQTVDRIVELNLFKDYSVINAKLILLRKLGLGYLTLFRTTDSLSGGESQRLKLTKYIGKRLANKLFIFDEPLVGLSSNDAINILSIFKDLTNEGSTVVFIEHNVLGFDYSDYIIELGPGKGKLGGEIIFEGNVELYKSSTHYSIYSSMK